MNIARDPIDLLAEHAREAVASLEGATIPEDKSERIGCLVRAIDHLRAAQSGATALLAELDRPGGAHMLEQRDITPAEISAVMKSWAIENARKAWRQGHRGTAFGYVCTKPRRLDKYLTVGCGGCRRCRALAAGFAREA